MSGVIQLLMLVSLVLLIMRVSDLNKTIDLVHDQQAHFVTMDSVLEFLEARNITVEEMARRQSQRTKKIREL